MTQRAEALLVCCDTGSIRAARSACWACWGTSAKGLGCCAAGNLKLHFAACLPACLPENIPACITA